MKDKKTLITIIILLVIFLPLSIIGTVKHFSVNQNNVTDDNINKEFIYNNKVYFYQNGILSSTYDCNNCSLPETVLDDKEYHTNSYLLGNLEFGPMLNDGWAIFKMGDKQALYNLVGKRIAVEYEAVKSYNVETDKNVLITKSKNKWGASFLDMSSKGIKNAYDYLALPSHFTNNVLETSKFIGKISNLWYMLNSDGTAIKPAITDEIVDFNDTYYIIFKDGSYKVMDYDDKEHLENLNLKNAFAVGKYIFAITTNDLLLIYEDCDATVLKNVKLPSYENIYFSKNDDGIAIMIDNKLHETVALN